MKISSNRRQAQFFQQHFMGILWRSQRVVYASFLSTIITSIHLSRSPIAAKWLISTLRSHTDVLTVTYQQADVIVIIS